MNNRFAKKKTDLTILRSLILPVICFGASVFLFGWGLNNLSSKTQEEQMKATREAITRAAVQCYAIEGQYPPDLEYLKAHYGIDDYSGRYIVDYQVFASNIMTTITVLPKEFVAEDSLELLPPGLEL